MPPQSPAWLPTLSRLHGLVWAAGVTAARGGLPDRVLYFKGGIGDDIMCTAVARALKQRGLRKVWLSTRNEALFKGNPDLVPVPADFRLYRFCGLFGIDSVEMQYDERPQQHFITLLSALVGVTGEVELLPRLFLADAEKAAGKRAARRQIAIQSSCLDARFPMPNKQWPAERFQTVVDRLKPDFDFVQVGALSDPPLGGCLDLRGRTTLRESASILAASHVFIGLATGLVHMARAVGCRSVIVYGGREDPSKSGYSANENLGWSGSCAPCWLRSQCDYERRCMTAIEPDAVIDAALRQVARFGTPLPTDREIIR